MAGSFWIKASVRKTAPSSRETAVSVCVPEATTTSTLPPPISAMAKRCCSMAKLCSTLKTASSASASPSITLTAIPVAALTARRNSSRFDALRTALVATTSTIRAPRPAMILFIRARASMARPWASAEIRPLRFSPSPSRTLAFSSSRTRNPLRGSTSTRIQRIELVPISIAARRGGDSANGGEWRGLKFVMALS